MATDAAIAAATTTTGVAQQAAATAQQSATLASDFSDFLQLLTIQLQNQDPLSPMDSTEFTNQLVQFSQVEQQINSNKKLDSLLALQLSAASTVGLGYVGMDISYTSSEMNYDGTEPVTINYALSSEASSAKVNIYNSDGDLVYSADAPKDAGNNKIVWDGAMSNGLTADAGTYTIRIDALDQDGEAIDNTTAVTGRVRGIETQNGVIYVLVGERAVPMSSIINATVPAATTQETTTA